MCSRMNIRQQIIEFGICLLLSWVTFTDSNQDLGIASVGPIYITNFSGSSGIKIFPLNTSEETKTTTWPEYSSGEHPDVSDAVTIPYQTDTPEVTQVLHQDISFSSPSSRHITTSSTNKFMSTDRESPTSSEVVTNEHITTKVVSPTSTQPTQYFSGDGLDQNPSIQTTHFEVVTGVTEVHESTTMEEELTTSTAISTSATNYETTTIKEEFANSTDKSTSATNYETTTIKKELANSTSAIHYDATTAEIKVTTPMSVNTTALDFTQAYSTNQSGLELTSKANEYYNSTEFKTIVLKGTLQPNLSTFPDRDQNNKTLSNPLTTEFFTTPSNKFDYTTSAEMIEGTTDAPNGSVSNQPTNATMLTYSLTTTASIPDEKNCDKVRHLLDQKFLHVHRPVISQKAFITFTLNITVTKNDSLQDMWSPSYCELSRSILESSEGPLAHIVGVVKYDKPLEFQADMTVVLITLNTDYSIGFKHKGLILRSAYTRGAFRNLRKRGIYMFQDSVQVALEQVDTKFLCGNRCSSHQRCHLAEDRYARWGVCTSECRNASYCLNGGICRYNSIGNQQCWCPSTAIWWFRGERCEISESQVMVVLIAGACGVLTLFVFLALLICMARRMNAPKKMESSSSWPRTRRNQAILDISGRQQAERATLQQRPLSFPSQVSIGMSTNGGTRSVQDTDSLPMRAKWSPRSGEQQLSVGLLRLKYNDHGEPTHGLVQATSFRRINSRERAEMSNLHGEATEESQIPATQTEIDSNYCNTVV